MLTFIEYPPCSTCRKAKKWLTDHELAFESRHIKEQRPTKEELKRWLPQTGLPAKKLFNTSGQLYRQLGLKDKLPTMTEEDMLELLSTDGMLVKRPLVLLENQVLVGFKEEQWEKALLPKA